MVDHGKAWEDSHDSKWQLTSRTSQVYTAHLSFVRYTTILTMLVTVCSLRSVYDTNALHLT